MTQLTYGADSGAIWDDRFALVAMAPKGLKAKELLKFIEKYPGMFDGLEFSSITVPGIASIYLEQN
jgi:hypothetical protein